ncbi:hypothetical protein F1654_05390 [Alkalicaulis satelles]|uniref:Uncharacterized protein n=1 Tax=Alkalicaulis satelles TaxID=2609175 RepID=A0A5M6ZKR4_9PROT|nr:hypothetical protein [Alkalicaulis satelles]KAA5805413.1 hypothetical protein F1654_05390 [Alkalicaulis satelles]
MIQGYTSLHAASALALGLCLFAGAASAQSQGVTRAGSVSGVIGDMAYEGSIPMPNPPNADLFDGAHYTVAMQGANLALQIKILAIGQNETIRNSPTGYYGDNAVQLDLVFEFTQDGRDAISADNIVSSSVTFIETWPSHVPSPALQYQTLFSQPAVSIDTFNWTRDGIEISGSVSGEACLYVYDIDQRGNRVNSQARVMGETFCPQINLDFSALATEEHM